MVILFNKDITEESVQELIYQLKDIQDYGILYFNTPGGDIMASESLIDFLNLFMIDKLTIVFTGIVASAGVNVMQQFEGEKCISENLDLIVVHPLDRAMGHTREPKHITNLQKYDKELAVIWFERLSSIIDFTPAEKKLYKKGKDIVIERKDFHRVKLEDWNTIKNQIKDEIKSIED